MRVISGQWRGRGLVAPTGSVTRPTADRMREALFSMLTSRIGGFEGLAVADLFAGSGALGIEALSRGAACCVFVEQDRAALTALRGNLEQLGAGRDEAVVRPVSVMALGPAAEPLDLLLLDPPYRTGAAAVALDRLARLGWTSPASWIGVETAHDEAVAVPGFSIKVERTHGKARLTLLRPDAA